MPEVYEGTKASTGSEGPCGFRHVEHAMGTVFSFDICDTPTPAIHRALDQAVVWLHWVDEVWGSESHRCSSSGVSVLVDDSAEDAGA